MKRFLVVWVLCFILVFNLNLFSAKIDDDLKDVLSGQTFLAEDFKTIAGFLTSELGKWMPFTTTAGNNTPANVCALPGVAIGGTFGITMNKFNIDGLKSLSLDYMSVDDVAKKLPATIALPTLNVYLKTGIIGLPVFKADVGIRFLPLNINITSNDTTFIFKNYLFGIDLRAQILEDSLLSPLGLLAILSLDFISGNFEITSKQESTQRVTVNSTDYDLTITGKNKWATDWTMQSIGIKLIANKSIAFFSPFVGAGLNINMGVLNSNIGIEGDVTLKDIPPLTGSATGKSGLIGTASKSPNGLDFRLIAGFELGLIPFSKLGLGFEWGGEVYSITAGLKIQIP